MLPDDLVRLSKIRSLAKSGAARSIRVGAGLSLGELAESLGVCVTTIYRWENSQRTPRGERAVAYADLLDKLVRR